MDTKMSSPGQPMSLIRVLRGTAAGEHPLRDARDAHHTDSAPKSVVAGTLVLILSVWSGRLEGVGQRRAAAIASLPISVPASIRSRPKRAARGWTQHRHGQPGDSSCPRH